MTGGTGLLGVNWAAAVRDRCSVWLGTHRRRVALPGVESVPIDLGSAGSLARTVEEIGPGLIVHAAGLSNVDDCERNPDHAYDVNARIAGTVAGVAAAKGVRLVHISTDHLFSGDRSMVDEESPTSPLNVYARTKLEGERAVARGCPRALIVRTNFFGWGHAYRESISDWILKGLRAGQPLNMLADAFFTPILADRLAHAVHELVDKGAAGVVHVAGDERVSKLQFARRLAAGFGLQDSAIRESRFSAMPMVARRPRDMSLSNAKARTLLGRALGGVDEFIAELRTQEETGRAREQRQAILG